MKVITKQEYYNSIPDRWYNEYSFLINAILAGINNGIIDKYKKLCKLDIPISQSDLICIFTKDSDWSNLRCDCCQKEVEKVIEINIFLDSTTGFLCDDCLYKGLMLIQSK